MPALKHLSRTAQEQEIWAAIDADGGLLGVMRLLEHAFKRLGELTSVFVMIVGLRIEAAVLLDEVLHARVALEPAL